jgi:hypothetical protein
MKELLFRGERAASDHAVLAANNHDMGSSLHFAQSRKREFVNKGICIEYI